jgi:hypothetical protein
MLSLPTSAIIILNVSTVHLNPFFLILFPHVARRKAKTSPLARTSVSLPITCLLALSSYFVCPEKAGKTLEELGGVFGDKTDDVEVAEKSPEIPLEAIEVIASPNAFVDQPEREHDAEDIHCGEESDEDDMVDVDVNSVDEEVEGRRELDGDIHRALLEAPSEVTLLVAEGEKKGGQEPFLEAKERTLEDVD